MLIFKVTWVQQKFLGRCILPASNFCVLNNIDNFMKFDHFYNSYDFFNFHKINCSQFTAILKLVFFKICHIKTTNSYFSNTNILENFTILIRHLFMSPDCLVSHMKYDWIFPIPNQSPVSPVFNKLDWLYHSTYPSLP